MFNLQNTISELENNIYEANKEINAWEIDYKASEEKVKSLYEELEELENKNRTNSAHYKMKLTELKFCEKNSEYYDYERNTWKNIRDDNLKSLKNYNYKRENQEQLEKAAKRKIVLKKIFFFLIATFPTILFLFLFFSINIFIPLIFLITIIIIYFADKRKFIFGLSLINAFAYSALILSPIFGILPLYIVLVPVLWWFLFQQCKNY